MSESPGKNFSLYAFVALHVLAPLTASALVDVFGRTNDAAYPLIVGTLLLAPAQAALLASVILLRDAPVGRMLISLAAVAFCLTVFYALCIALIERQFFDDRMAALVLSLATAPTLVDSAFFALARRSGWRWRRADDPPGPPVRLTIARAIGATVAIAAMFALARWVREHPTVAEELSTLLFELVGLRPSTYLAFELVVLVSCFWLATMIGLVAGSGPRWSWLNAGAALALVACLGVLAWYVRGAKSDNPSETVDRVALWTTIAAFYSLASLGGLRLLGWRIDRVPTEPATTATSSASTADAVADSPFARDAR